MNEQDTGKPFLALSGDKKAATIRFHRSTLFPLFMMSTLIQQKQASKCESEIIHSKLLFDLKILFEAGILKYYYHRRSSKPLMQELKFWFAHGTTKTAKRWLVVWMLLWDISLKKYTHYSKHLTLSGKQV